MADVFGAPAAAHTGIDAAFAEVSAWLPWTAQGCERPQGCAGVRKGFPCVGRWLAR